MRIVVDRDRCVGHGLCESFAPEVFEIDDSGDLVIVGDPAGTQGTGHTVAEEFTAAVEQAIASCPTEALSWGAV